MTQDSSSHESLVLSASSSSASRSRTRRKPPTSLPDHFGRKGYLSVSDLVGPSWCEYSYQYGVLSLSHLPPSQRPQTIETEGGQSLTASVERSEEREKILEGGKAVHTVLERQVAPVQVAVQTESREDVWALRLLNLWCDIQALLQLDPASLQKAKGKEKERCCVREVPVYGWIQGVFVMGVIDEIEKRTTASASQVKQAKTWSSQEEWKREQQRKPKTSPTKAKDVAKGHVSLATFFQNPSQAPKANLEEAPVEEDDSTEPKWSYFLSDTKTRISSWLPAKEDQYGSRMQCMTYRRLFDGLCLGALLAVPNDSTLNQAESLKASKWAHFDAHATPMDWDHTFASQNVEKTRAVSDAFLTDAVSLCESWGTDLFSFVQDKCTLDNIRLLLEHSLRQLVFDAMKGQGVPKTATSVGVLQPELALNYRQQKKWKRSKRKTTAQQSSQKATKAQTAAATKEQADHAQPTLDTLLTSKVAEGTHGASEREVSASVDDVAEDVRQSMDAVDGHNEVIAALSQAFTTPSSTPKKPALAAEGRIDTDHAVEDASAIASGDAQEEPNYAVIGVVRFQHDGDALNTHLSRMLAMWKGERRLRGVNLSQTKRCWKCEWRDGCEWRTLQSDTALQQAAARAAKQTQAPPDDVQDIPPTTVTTGSDEEGFWNDVDYSAIQVKDPAGNLLDW